MATTLSSSSHSWKKSLPAATVQPEKPLRKRSRQQCAASDAQAKRPRQKRWPSAPPAPPASARETAENAAWAADSKPAARQEAEASRTASGISASGIHQRRLSPGSVLRRQPPAARPAPRRSCRRQCIETRAQFLRRASASAGSAWRPKSKLFSILTPGSSVAWRISTQRCSQLRGQINGRQSNAQRGGQGSAQHGRPASVQATRRPAPRRPAGSWPSRPAAHSRATRRPPPAPAERPSRPARAATICCGFRSRKAQKAAAAESRSRRSALQKPYARRR